MGESSDCLSLLFGCSFCCMWVAYIVCGSLALSWTFDDAKECGWWLWGTFVAELIYVPFAIILGGAYSAFVGAAVFCMDEEDTSTGNAVADGCMQGCGLLVMNICSGLIIGFTAHSVWGVDEACMHGTWLYSMALFGFYTCAVITGINLVLAALKFCKSACGAS